MMGVTAAIVAGGNAVRLGGRHKPSLRLGSASLLERQLSVLRDVADRIIVIGEDAPIYQSCGVRAIPDALPGNGALGGVYTAIASAFPDLTLVVAGDMPFLEPSFLNELIELGRDVDIAIPRTARGYEPLCATYSQRCAGVIRRQIDAGRLKMTDVLAAGAGLVVREVGTDEIERHGRPEVLFFNINSEEDYGRALTHFSSSLVP